VKSAVDIALFQQVAAFTIARDLTRDLEVGSREARHEVLIELARPGIGGRDLAGHRAAVVEALAAIHGTLRPSSSMNVSELRHFVAAELTRFEIESLADRLGSTGNSDFSVRRVWRDAQKRALLEISARTVHAAAAQVAYSALGEGIEWAVLDTGVRADHPHFVLHSNVVREVNCTTDANDDDRSGHGTHVAGIIAGEYTEPGSGRRITGISPKTKLHVYKVLNNSGSGRDSWIIRALDDVARFNEEAGWARIQGVNLSLGGSFDVSTYACGHSPLCRELRRLWRQGVLVVLAAGNEGFATLESDSGPIDANMDLSIGDPANLEEGIAVGSVHKEQPHTYCIS
jgi:subtilisin family serine protease